MNFLQLVQKTVRKSGAKIEEPTTVVGQTGLSALFVEWVQEAWKEIQLERLGLYWRTDRDLTLSLVDGTDEYNIPGTLESLNLRSLTRHLSNEDEGVVVFRTYDFWRRWVDRVDRSEGPPTYFTITPSGTIAFWPIPDDSYTIRYEGILAIEELDYTDAAGVGTSDALVPTNIDVAYHDAIVWQAVIYYAMHFEDGSKLSEGRARFKPYKKYFEERYMPIVEVDTTAMYDTVGDWFYV